MLLRVSSRKYRRPLMRWDFISKRTTASQTVPPLSYSWPISRISRKNGRWEGEKEKEKEEEPRELGMVWLVTFSTNCFKFSSPLSPLDCQALDWNLNGRSTRYSYYVFLRVSLRREVLLALYWWSYSSWLNVTVGQF